jgi:excisionase family DNA binding protein
MEKLLKITELAELLNINKFALYNMVYANKIPYVKIGKTNRSIRFDIKKINAWLDKNSCDTILNRK